MSTKALDITLYHNPRCSKSRAALELLRACGIEPRIVEYLKTPLDRTQLSELAAKLALEPAALVRKGEDIFKEHYQGRTLSADDWIAALAQHPILLERPIAVRGEQAVVGRPPERVLELIEARDS
jgi:arsenate reductase